MRGWLVRGWAPSQASTGTFSPREDVPGVFRQAHFRLSIFFFGGVHPPTLLLLSGNTAVSSNFAR
jgi:hypothetical protein